MRRRHFNVWLLMTIMMCITSGLKSQDSNLDFLFMQFSGCEGNRQQELIGLYSLCGFYVDDLMIRLDPDFSPNAVGIDGDINDGGLCGWMVGDTSLFTGCDGLHPAGPGDLIPANALVIIQMTQDVGNIRSIEEQCKTGLPIYVIRNSCVRTVEAFPVLRAENYQLEMQLEGRDSVVFDARFHADMDRWTLPLVQQNRLGQHSESSCILPAKVVWDDLIRSKLTINQVSVQQLNCRTDRGRIEVASAGPVGSYSIDGGITWQVDSIFTDLEPGSYQIMFRDTSDMCPLEWPHLVEIKPYVPIQIIGLAEDSIPSCARHEIGVVATGFNLLYSSDGFNYSQDSVVALEPGKPTTIYVQNSYNAACSDSLEVTLHQDTDAPIEIIGLAEDTIIPCADQEIGIVATGQNLLYSSNGFNYSQDSVVALKPWKPTTIYVKNSDHEECMDSLLVTLYQHPKHLSFPSLCGNTAEMMTYLHLNGNTDTAYLDTEPEGKYQYLWSTGDTTRVVRELPYGVNSYTVTDAWGCKDGAQFEAFNSCVFRLTDSIVDATCETPTTSIYLNSTDTVNQYDYDWSIDSFDGLPYLENVNHGTFHVEVSYDCCTKTITYTTPLGGIESVDYLTEPIQCNGELGSIFIKEVIGGQGPYQIDLTGERFDSNLTIYGLPQGMHNFSIVDVLGCWYQDSFEILAEIEVPVVEPLISFDCETKLYTLDLSKIRGGIAPYELRLNNTPSSDNTIVDLSPGAYELEVFDASGCSSGIIPIELSNKGDISINLDTSVQVGEILQLRAMGDLSLLDNYYWEGPEGFLCDCSQLTIRSAVAGKYIFYYVTEDGCEGDLSFNVNVFETNIYIPNSFTPNGDNMNDDFEVYAPSHEVLTLYIFNRWGDKVFSATGPDFIWNGQMGDAKAAPGAYIYQAILQAPDGRTQQETGSVTLIR